MSFLCTITLYLAGEKLRENEVTRAIGHSPTNFFSIGQKMVPGNPASAIYKKSIWKLRQTFNTSDIGTSLEEFMSEIARFLVSELDATDAFLDVFATQDVIDDTFLGADIECNISALLIKELADRGLGLKLALCNVPAADEKTAE